jgi:hypothetical protein
MYTRTLPYMHTRIYLRLLRIHTHTRKHTHTHTHPHPHPHTFTPIHVSEYRQTTEASQVVVMNDGVTYVLFVCNPISSRCPARFSAGLSTAAVVDIGAGATRVAPVFEGYLLQKGAVDRACHRVISSQSYCCYQQRYCEDSCFAEQFNVDPCMDTVHVHVHVRVCPRAHPCVALILFPCALARCPCVCVCSSFMMCTTIESAASLISALAGNRLDEEILRSIETAVTAATGAPLRPRFSFKKKVRPLWLW